MQILRRGTAVEIPVRLEQIEHSRLDDVPRDAGGEISTGARTVGCLVDGATSAAHAVEDRDQPEVRPVSQNRIGVLALIRDLGEVEGERERRPGRGHGPGARRPAGGFAHTELPMESTMVP